MSVVIDTSDLDMETELYSDAPESELPDAAASDDQPKELQPELDDVDPPAPPAAIDQSEDGDDEDDFRSKIWNAEMRCRGKEAIVEDLKEQLKFAKADYDDSVAALRKLATWGKDTSKDASPNTDGEDDVAQTELDTNNDSLDAQPPAESYDESWKSHSLIEMIKSADIAGLGEKKLDALADVCQTFGDFEALRTKASLDGVHLKEVLPTGFGEKITDQIEEAYFSAIKTISSQTGTSIERVYETGGSSDLPGLPSVGTAFPEEKPEIVESVCESDSASKPIDLDDL
jgi:hypothetical protein